MPLPSRTDWSAVRTTGPFSGSATSPMAGSKVVFISRFQWTSVLLLTPEFSTKFFANENCAGKETAAGDLNGMNERTGALPAASELATKRRPG